MPSFSSTFRSLTWTNGTGPAGFRGGSKYVSVGVRRFVGVNWGFEFESPDGCEDQTQSMDIMKTSYLYNAIENGICHRKLSYAHMFCFRETGSFVSVTLALLSPWILDSRVLKLFYQQQASLLAWYGLMLWRPRNRSCQQEDVSAKPAWSGSAYVSEKNVCCNAFPWVHLEG